MGIALGFGIALGLGLGLGLGFGLDGPSYLRVIPALATVSRVIRRQSHSACTLL